VIREAERDRKAAARRREAEKREQHLQEAVEMLHIKLGDQLAVFII
jgi:hypothetical protein